MHGVNIIRFKSEFVSLRKEFLDLIKYLITLKSGIPYKVFQNYGKTKIDFNDELPLEKKYELLLRFGKTKVAKETNKN